MGKKVSWYWVFAAILVGWVFGNSPPDKAPVQKFQQTQSQGVTSHQRQARLPVQKKMSPNTKRTTPKVSRSPKVKAPVRTMYVDANRLNVRNAPDKSAKQVWTLKRDERVIVAGKNGDWLFVKGRRYEGWVFGTYLTPKKAPAKSSVSTLAPTIVAPKVSDAKIKKELIKRSLALYSGNCPCPYNRARGGSRCGRRSAYSRPGGASPLCFPTDITKQMVRDYRSRL